MRSYHFHKNRKNLSIGKIICLARTYKKHAEEMKTNTPPNPLLFLKPASAVIFSGESIIYPKISHCVHHEVEMGIVIEKRASNISKDKALDVVAGYVVGLDITARDIQSIAKKNGWPWGIAKGFDTFAPISDVVSVDDVDDPDDFSFKLWVNSKLRQQGETKNLIWNVKTLISYISSIMTLEPGDLILTGTPEGVSEIRIDDQITAELTGLINLSVDVKPFISKEKN
ncbi:MAG: fumarylacetoacetate hydrolase family protein [Candidatus Thermoplasmatota archaeon]|nr:fumarylacetoacetate hydrolase family protein [Candidatus Thermoplasmatota archaeon]